MTDDASPENLRKFLESDDPAMVRMGISLAKGSGVPEELLPTILGLYMWDDDKNVRTAARTMFFKHAPAEIQAKVKENWKASYRTLSITGDKFPEAVRPFLEAFKSQDDFAEIALEPLIKVLRDGDYRVVKVLGNIGDERAVEPLIETLRDDNQWHASWAASTTRLTSIVEALGQIGDARAVKPLIKALRDRSVVVRQRTAVALGRIGDARAVGPLIKALGDDDAAALLPGAWRIRRHAVEALGVIGAARAVEPLTKALGDEHFSVRESAASALGVIGDKRAVEPLIKALGDGNWRVAKAAVMALGDMDDSRAVEALISTLRDINRRDAAEALANLGWEPDTDELRIVYLVARGDAKALVKWGKPAVKPLINALGDDEDTVCWHAASALGSIGDARAIGPLIKALEGGNSAAAKALGMIGAGRAVRPLIKALKDDDWRVRMYVAEALGEIGDARAVEPLTKALRDDKSGVRKAAEESLRKLGHEVE